jgi:hypothetical protein
LENQYLFQKGRFTVSKESSVISEGPEIQGILEYLFSGPATAKLLDFFVTYKDFDYSETDIGELADVSAKTVIKELPKLEALGLIKHTRKVGRAKMYKLDIYSPTAKALQQFAFLLAEKDIQNMNPLQEKIETEDEAILEQNNSQ